LPSFGRGDLSLTLRKRRTPLIPDEVVASAAVISKPNIRAAPAFSVWLVVGLKETSEDVERGGAPKAVKFKGKRRYNAIARQNRKPSITRSCSVMK
jgi:hypothetical protein